MRKPAKTRQISYGSTIQDHMYVRECKHICGRIYIYMHICICYIYVYMCIIYTYIYICEAQRLYDMYNAYVRISYMYVYHICSKYQTVIHTHAHVHVHIQKHIRMYVHMYRFICVHTHTHAPQTKLTPRSSGLSLLEH